MTRSASFATLLCLLLAGARPVAAQEPRLRLGPPRNITSAISLYQPLSVDVGPDGAFFIGDRGEGQIIKLSFEGETVWRVGGKGQGPGEFGLLYRLCVGSDGGVAAFDLGNQDLSSFAADGSFVRRVDLETRVHAVGSIALLTDGSVAMVAHIDRSPQHSIHVFDTDGSLTRSFGPVPPVRDAIQLRDWLAGFLYRSGSDLIFTLNIPYEIHRYSSRGDLLSSIRRPYEFPEGPGGELPEHGAGRAGFTGPPKFVPHPVGAKDLGDGWLLAGVIAEPDRAIWDVFHHGELVASYPAPNGWIVVDTDPQRGVLYVRSEDDAGEAIYLQIPYSVDDRPLHGSGDHDR